MMLFVYIVMLYCVVLRSNVGDACICCINAMKDREELEVHAEEELKFT